jgi:hypothetical protein
MIDLMAVEMTHGVGWAFELTTPGVDGSTTEVTHGLGWVRSFCGLGF